MNFIRKLNTILSFSTEKATTGIPWTSGQISALEDRKNVFYASIIRKVQGYLDLAEKTYKELLDIYNISNEARNDHDLKILIKHTKKRIEEYKRQIEEVNGWIEEVNEKMKERYVDYKFFHHGLKDLNVKPFKAIDVEAIRKNLKGY